MNKIRAYTFNPILPFDLIFNCTTCGYLLDLRTEIQQCKIVDLVDDIQLNKECPNCGGGSFNYRFCAFYNYLLDRQFNALGFRFMNVGSYFRTAFDDGCADNICNCPQKTEYTVMSYSKAFPFVCVNCVKCYISPNFLKTRNVSFGFLRVMQLDEIFLLSNDHLVEHKDFTDLNAIETKCIKFTDYSNRPEYKSIFTPVVWGSRNDNAIRAYNKSLDKITDSLGETKDLS